MRVRRPPPREKGRTRSSSLKFGAVTDTTQRFRLFRLAFSCATRRLLYNLYHGLLQPERGDEACRLLGEAAALVEAHRSVGLHDRVWQRR